MIIPPAPVGDAATTALAAPFGWLDRTLLQDLAATGRTPIFLHSLSAEDRRKDRGPRELREMTEQALAAAGWTAPWGVGAICQTTEDAAHFATAGYTWFTLELSDFVIDRAATLSLDALDGAIVALEDAGAYAPGWHERYLASASSVPFPFPDEVLARCAVRFAGVLTEIGQLIQTIRISSSERGELPDLEISVARSRTAGSAEDVAFLAAEAISRGAIHGSVVRLAPALGHHYEPGREVSLPLPGALTALPAALPPGAILSVPAPLGNAAGWTGAHLDGTDACRLAYLRHLATTDPGAFRTWLQSAHAEFSTALARFRVSTNEDDVRFLPEVADDALVTTFLDTLVGRQLLLATWDDVAGLPTAAQPVG